MSPDLDLNRKVPLNQIGPWPPHFAAMSATQIGPWPPHFASVALVSTLSLKRAASKLPDGQTQRELSAAADQAIAELVDDFCGTPPHPIPALMLASVLAAFAEDLEKGELQAAILQEAGRIAEKGLGGGASRTAAAARR